MDVSLLKLPHDEIIFEDYPDEMVLLDLPRGVYFTLNRSGADCLLTLLAADRYATAIEILRAHFAASTEAVTAVVGALLDLLAANSLAVPRPDGEPGLDLPAPPAGGAPLDPPRLERYQDIEDILKFDPVHEVTDSGWPNLRDPDGGH